ncbi:hypothetical protein EVAR_54123_1 [Eumeta japonica]|uniref:Endonuclease/exonuclease/phosphatase domain-containing protein n=1 Tax=Eumeta variegata TaxID=151549 RepID=A0A4C1YWX2_EUMVA|nr:hypothetical protein EVAR_54123_1 [Eumeta japonica]
MIVFQSLFTVRQFSKATVATFLVLLQLKKEAIIRLEALRSFAILDFLASRLGTWSTVALGRVQSEENAKSSKRMFSVVQDVLESRKLWKTLYQASIPSAQIVILGDFNAPHKEWLGSRTTDYAGRILHDFALSYGLTKLNIELAIVLVTDFYYMLSKMRSM